MNSLLLFVISALFVLSGVGFGLGWIGYRKRIGLVMWLGIMVLVVLIAVVAVEVLFMIPCMLGAGCI